MNYDQTVEQRGSRIAERLFDCQSEVKNFILHRGGSGAIFHEMGLGKTRSALEIYMALKEKEPRLKLLVICEPGAIGTSWKKDIFDYMFDHELLNCRKEEIPSSVVEPIFHQYDIFAINYETLIWKPRQDPNCIESVSRKSEIASMPALAAIKRLMLRHPFMIVVDESSRMRNHKSLTVGALFYLRDDALARIVMSGTPAPNGPHEYWAQMEFVAPGLLNRNFYNFQREFFHMERETGNRLLGYKVEKLDSEMIPRSAAGLQMAFSQGWHWEISEASRQRLMKIITTAAHFALKKDYHDLPEENDESREVELGAKQRKAYNAMKNHLITEIDDSKITGEVLLKKFMKLREICSGFAIDDLGIAVPIGQNAKMDELERVMDEIPEDQQVIVWGHFTWELQEIAKNLNKRFDRAKQAYIYGEDGDTDKLIQNFQAGRFRILVAHPAAAGKSLNLQNCNIQIFFSLSYSWDQYHQARSRIHRAGQKRACTFVHLLAKDTLDAELLEVLKTKQKTEAILYGIAKAQQYAVA